LLSRTATRLKTNEADLFTVGEIEAVTQLAAKTFVNRVFPLTLTDDIGCYRRDQKGLSREILHVFWSWINWYASSDWQTPHGVCEPTFRNLSNFEQSPDRPSL
jgi:hypothetical protein